jgi:hypothetical protein
MRGRKPRPLLITAPDHPILQAVARARHLAWFQVQHARIVLAVAHGESIQAVASRLECNPSTVWRVCRRYEQGGLEMLLLDDSRVGRPQEISPPSREPRSSNWPAWSRLPRACTSPTGPARISPVKRSPTESWAASVPAPSAESWTMWTCSRTAPATGGPLAWTADSGSERRKSFGPPRYLDRSGR